MICFKIREEKELKDLKMKVVEMIKRPINNKSKIDKRDLLFQANKLKLKKYQKDLSSLPLINSKPKMLIKNTLIKTENFKNIMDSKIKPIMQTHINLTENQTVMAISSKNNIIISIGDEICHQVK